MKKIFLILSVLALMMPLVGWAQPDCEFECPCFDMGDISRCNYPTLTNNPAHGLTGVAWLGQCISFEFFPRLPNSDNCDDGVSYMNLPWMPCEVQQVEVTVTAGPNYARYLECGRQLYLSGWKDGNLDGDFCDTLCDGTAPEWIVQDVPVTAGVFAFSFLDPGVFDMGVYDGVFRWRLSSQPVGAMGFGLVDIFGCPGMICGTYALDLFGEVEDDIVGDAQLAVNMSGFQALAGDQEVTLHWTTASETANDRFEVLRDQVIAAMVPSQGSSAGGYEYTWTDRDVTNGVPYVYTLVAVDDNNNRQEVATESVIPSFANGLVTDYRLYQNYPNPFNPTTKIAFDLAEDDWVTLRVFNPIGQEVATVMNGTMQKGRHVLIFDALNLPSGVYIYRIEAGNFSDQKKMILIK